MTTKQIKEQKKKEMLMSVLECTEEEALDIIEHDNIIDSGGRSKYDLPIDQEKEAIRISAIDERKAKDQSTNGRGKNRAENTTKSGIIENLFKFLKEMADFQCENVQITNKERQIAFKIADDNYELTLVQKRKPKK